MIPALTSRLLVAAATVCVAAAAHAQSFPNKPVKIVVPFGAGGVTDLIARQMGERMTPGLGQQVIVENRPGQGGSLGPGYVAKSDPDGYTLILAGSANAIGETLYKNLPFSLLKDFAPITRVASIVNVMIVNPSVKANSVQEVVALAKAQPGKMTYASSGNGGVYHLVTEMFKSMTGTNILHVPYRTEPAGRTDVIGGRADMMITAYGVAAPNMRAGQIRVLAVTSPARFADLPDVPTIAESGVPGYNGDAWVGLLAPAGTPPAVVDRIHAEVAKVLAQPDFRAKLGEQALTPIEDTPAEFAAFLKADVEKWRKIIQASGAKVD